MQCTGPTPGMQTTLWEFTRSTLIGDRIFPCIHHQVDSQILILKNADTQKWSSNWDSEREPDPTGWALKLLQLDSFLTILLFRWGLKLNENQIPPDELSSWWLLCYQCVPRTRPSTHRLDMFNIFSSGRCMTGRRFQTQARKARNGWHQSPCSEIPRRVTP